MWVFTTQGFYSVVAHRDDPDLVLVRARSDEDLEALRKQIPNLQTSEDSRADYRFRAVVAREEWVRALTALAVGIDYPNFKSEVAVRQGAERERVYSRVWAIMRSLQERS